MVERFFTSNQFDSEKPSPLGFFIFGFEEKPHLYPTPEQLLPQLRVAQNSDLLNVHYLDSRAKSTTVLHLAAQMGCVSSLSYCLSAPRKIYGNPEITDGTEQNSLHHAARRGHYDIVSALLKQPGYPRLVNSKHQHTGMTALHFAAANGHTKTVALLLEYNADINLESELGHTALVEAAINKRTDIVKLLLSRLPPELDNGNDDPNFTTLINRIYQIPSDDIDSFKIGISLLQELVTQKFILSRLSLESNQSLYLAGQEVYKTAYQTACQLLISPNPSLLSDGLLVPLQRATEVLIEPTEANITNLKTITQQTYGSKSILKQFLGALICLVGVAMIIAGALGMPFTGGASIGMCTLGGLSIAGGATLFFGGATLFFNGRKEGCFSKSLGCLADYVPNEECLRI